MATNLPYGDIYQVNTAPLDRLSQQIRSEQQLRQQQQLQNSKMLDEEFSRSMAGMREPDIAPLTQAYGDFKLAAQNVYKKGTNATVADQMDMNKKKAAMYDIINQSKLKALEEKSVATNIMADKTGTYKDDATQTLMAGRQLPYNQQLNYTDPSTGKTTPIDWTDPNNLKRHINSKLVAATFKSASLPPSGKVETYMPDKYKEKPTDLNYVQPTVSIGATPTQFYNTMRTAARQDPVSFLNTLGETSPQDYANVENQYNQLMANPAIKSQWKMGTNEDLPPDDNLTDVEKAIKYEAMKYALSPINQPRITKTTLPAGKKAEMDYQSNLTMQHIRLANQYKGNDPATINANADNIIQDHIKLGKLSDDGTVPMDAGTFKTLTGIDKKPTSKIAVDDGGNYNYWKTNTLTGEKVPGGTIPYFDAKTKLIHGYKSGLSGDYNTGNTPPKTTPIKVITHTKGGAPVIK